MKNKEIIIGKSIGFCFGVTRAINMAKKVLEKEKVLTSTGDLVHNPLVMAELKKMGFQVIDDISQAKSKPFIIRSHGLPPDQLKKVRCFAKKVYDATCPFVRKVQKLVRKLINQDYFIFFVGDPEHPEMIAMEKIAGKNCAIIKPGTGSINIPLKKNWAIIAQTTISLDLYYKAITTILKNIPEERVTIFNTICPVSVIRQKEATDIASKVDALIVVGGKKSSNTNKLFHLGRKVNKNTFLIEDPAEVEKLEIEKFKKIGIISGASTDVNCIKELVRILKYPKKRR